MNFHRGQRKAWDSLARFIAVLAGTQGGKTVFGPVWMWREIQRKGAGDYIVGTPTFPLLNLKLLPTFLSFFQVLLGLGTFNQSSKVFTVSREGEIKLFGKEQTEPTRVIFASAQNAESIESATAKAAWLDECGQKQFRRETWDAVLRRLAIDQGRVLMTTTLYTLGWLKNEIYNPWARGETTIDVIQFPSTMNPVFPEEEYSRAEGSMPHWKFVMFYRGEFAKPAGLVYDCFNDEVCIYTPGPEVIPLDWPRYVGHDFGGQNPAVLFYALNPFTGDLNLYREYKPRGLSVPEQVRELRQMSKEENIVKRVGGNHQEVGWRESYTQCGWPITEPLETEREPQIASVYALKKANRVRVSSDCLGYRDENDSFSYKLDDNLNPTDEIEDEKRYHFMAAERYILSELKQIPRPNKGGASVKVY